VVADCEKPRVTSARMELMRTATGREAGCIGISLHFLHKRLALLWRAVAMEFKGIVDGND
jgi:hypothetical protein